MRHPIYRVVSFEIVGPYRIHVRFNDETTQDIDFRPVLEGELFGPLVDEVLFNQVRIDSEVHTLVWSQQPVEKAHPGYGRPLRSKYCVARHRRIAGWDSVARLVFVHNGSASPAERLYQRTANDADFDPATLHDWPIHEEELRKMAGRWSDALTANERG